MDLGTVEVQPAIADIPLDGDEVLLLLWVLFPRGPGLNGSYMDQPNSSCWPETSVDHKKHGWPEPSVDHHNSCWPEPSRGHKNR
ncbi:unnamed protein product [Gadus morhua 'NCC']